jgi:hypothetical protein
LVRILILYYLIFEHSCQINPVCGLIWKPYYLSWALSWIEQWIDLKKFSSQKHVYDTVEIQWGKKLTLTKKKLGKKVWLLVISCASLILGLRYWANDFEENFQYIYIYISRIFSLSNSLATSSPLLPFHLLPLVFVSSLLKSVLQSLFSKSFFLTYMLYFRKLFMILELIIIFLSPFLWSYNQLFFSWVLTQL